MATPNRKPQPTATPASPTAPTTATARPATATAARTSDATKVQQPFLFDRSNYMWMLGGLALIILGFFLLSGGKSSDPRQFNYDEIYSFRRITLAPLLMLIGFGIEVYAIMKRPKSLAGHKETEAH